MKNALKFVLSFVIILSVFTSCQSYKVVHFNRDEITNIGPNVTNYKVYIHDSTAIYKVDKPNFSSAGIKGDLTPVLNPDTIAEIKNPHTRKQMKKHEHDLNIYTKKEVTNSPNVIVLKKANIIDISHLAAKGNIGNAAGAIAILGLGVVVWVVIIKSFQGLL